VALFDQQILDTLPGLVAAFGTPAPTSFKHRTIAASFSIYGWSIATDPGRAIEFLELGNVSKSGLPVSGSGTTVVTAPPLYAASRPVSVVVNGTAMNVVATPAGQITFIVKLGSANTQQQFRLGSATEVTTAHVTLVQN
jgi:hypothetical protein